MNDMLEEIKHICHWGVASSDVAWLIDEVERLREENRLLIEAGKELGLEIAKLKALAARRMTR